MFSISAIYGITIGSDNLTGSSNFRKIKRYFSHYVSLNQGVTKPNCFLANKNIIVK